MGRGGCEPSADSEYRELFRWWSQAVVCKSGGVCFGRWESWDVVNSSFSCTWRSRFEDEILYVHLKENSADLILPADAPKIVLDMRRKPGCASATMRSWQTKDVWGGRCGSSTKWVMNCDRPRAMVAGWLGKLYDNYGLFIMIIYHHKFPKSAIIIIMIIIIINISHIIYYWLW